jgi:hypothetical protein
MALTPEQKAIMKADIAANFSTVPNNSDGAASIAASYNALAVPNFTVWKTSVPLRDIGLAMDGNETSNLTATNTSRLQVRALYMVPGEDPSTTSTRVFYDSIFSVGGITKAALLILWKRLATRVEKLYAVGTGSDPSPAIMGFEGAVSHQDVLDARNS